MECHVSTPKPFKKRDVRPFLLLIDEADNAIISPQSKFLSGTTDDDTQKQHQQLLQQSLFSSRRSSDSGIVSPTRHNAEPFDSDSSIVVPAAAHQVRHTPPARSADKGNKSDDGSAKRTPFCGRCRNHWPDKPVLVKGQSLFPLHILSSDSL